MRIRGFTLVEVLMVVTVLGILSSVVVVGYTPFQKRSASSVTKAEIERARGKLELHNGLERDYPPNLAGIDYTAPETVAMTLYTNAPQLRIYENLTVDQNAQLFLNSCNASMPVYDGAQLYATSCAFAGNNIHVKGIKSSNIVYKGKVVEESEVFLDCGSSCDTAIATIKNDFIAQGGTWPITVPKGQVTMPEPTLQSYGKATRFCLAARYVRYTDVAHHMINGSSDIFDGDCPSDPELHYP